MKILVKGYYGFGNLGDDLLLKVSLEIIENEYPDSEIHIFSNNLRTKSKLNANYLKRLFGKYHIVDWSDKEMYDIIYYGGGGVFFDYSSGGIFRRLINTASKVISPNIIYKASAVLRNTLNKYTPIQGKKRIAYGISIGPFSLDSIEFLSKYIEIGSLSKIMVRDDKSINFLKKIRYSGKLINGYDIVFDLDIPLSLLEQKRSNSSRYIGIIIMKWFFNHSKLINELKQLEKQLLGKGYSVRWISFDSNHDQDIILKFENNIIVWDPGIMTFEGIFNLLNEFDVIISTRFHGIVLSALLNIPSIPIKINPKIETLCDQLKGGVAPVKFPFEAKEIEIKIENIFDSYSIYQKNLTKNVKKIKSRIKQVKKEFWFSNV